MWEFLTDLPPLYKFLIVSLMVVGVVIISIWGSLSAKSGSFLSLGKSKEEQKKDKRDIKKFKSRRSCGDCVLILMAEREKYELSMRKTTDKILKYQMNFAEQKLIEIQNIFIDVFSQEYSKKKDESDAHETHAVQTKLFYGLLKDMLYIVKDEIRRSYKENGFYELGGSDFSNYVKDKMKVFMSMLQQYIRNIYPGAGVAITGEDVVKIIETKYHEVEDIVFEMFTQAKETRNDLEKQAEDLKIKFAEWIDKFTG